MDTKYFPWILIAVLIIALVIMAWFLGHRPKPNDVTIGKETTTIKVVVHDTVVNTKVLKDIKIQKVYVRDTVSDTALAVPDSTVCYSFDQKENDGAYIKATVCSDSLPLTPEDLKGEILYQAAPDSEKTIHRTDTMTVYKKHPAIKDWKTWALGALVMVLGGVLVGNAVHQYIMLCRGHHQILRPGNRLYGLP